VFERLALGVHDDSAPSTVQARGVRLEPRVLAMYAAETGQRVVRTPPHTLYAREDWATATPDARTADRLVEAKTDRDAWNWGPSYTHIPRWEPGAERVVRVDYWLQTQFQMWVCDVAACDLAVLVPGADPFEPELRVYHIDRDDDALARVVSRLRSWWQRHVVEGVEPPIDASDAAGRALARIERAGQREASIEEARLAAAYAAAAETEKAAREAKRAAGRLLVARAGGARRLDLPDGGHVTVISSVGTAELDEGALLDARPDLAEVLAEHRRPRTPYAFPRVVPGKRRADVVPR
jgi:predicted phage-related endonuclease